MKWPGRLPFALAVGISMLASCSDVRKELPEKIGISETLASSGSGLFTEGCTSVVYRLSDDTEAALRRQGIGFFAHIAPPQNQNHRNRYSAWLETPLARSHRGRVFALRAIAGCDGESGDFHGREIDEALRTPGSFYALTANREGMMIVVPRRRIAAFLYFG